MPITEVTGVSSGTPKDYMLQNLKMMPLQSDLENFYSATNGRTTLHLCSYSRLVSPIILHFTKIKPFESYKK